MTCWAEIPPSPATAPPKKEWGRGLFSMGRGGRCENPTLSPFLQIFSVVPLPPFPPLPPSTPLDFQIKSEQQKGKHGKQKKTFYSIAQKGWTGRKLDRQHAGGHERERHLFFSPSSSSILLAPLPSVPPPSQQQNEKVAHLNEKKGSGAAPKPSSTDETAARPPAHPSLTLPPRPSARRLILA